MARTHFQVAGLLAVVLATACGPMPSNMDGDGGAQADGSSDSGASPDSASAPSDSDAGASADGASGPVFADRVVEFTPGPGAGFGQSRMPGIVLGAPEGAGDMLGSTHVVSLGRGGRICLAMAAPIVDGPGADFIVFENAFYVAGSTRTFVELGEVSVSDDGQRFVTFSCDRSAPYAGCAGVNPVYSNPRNGLDPTDPRYAGGDAFDLATVSLTRASIVCIRDLETESLMPPSSGFDLDAIAAIHSTR